MTGQLQELEQVLTNLKTMVNGNKLIESRSLSVEAGALVKHANSAWLNLRDEIAEPQRSINALHGLSLLVGGRKSAKLAELKARYAGTQIEQLLQRLFD